MGADEVAAIAAAGAVAGKLIDALKSATGVAYEPKRIIRKASAEARAEMIKAEGERAAALYRAGTDVESVALAVRAARRLAAREFDRQENLDATSSVQARKVH